MYTHTHSLKISRQLINNVLWSWIQEKGYWLRIGEEDLLEGLMFKLWCDNPGQVHVQRLKGGRRHMWAMNQKIGVAIKGGTWFGMNLGREAGMDYVGAYWSYNETVIKCN